MAIGEADRRSRFFMKRAGRSASAAPPKLIEATRSDNLIDRARGGDTEAIAELYRAHVSMVLGYMRANGAVNPEDATGDVFVGMLKSLPRFEGNESDFRGWLMTIAYRRLTDGRRKKGRRPSEQQLDASTIDWRTQRTRTDQVDHMAVNSELVTAIGNLTDEQRQIVGLRFIADLPIESVASITGQSVSGVKAMQRRALATLRRAMGDNEKNSIVSQAGGQ